MDIEDRTNLITLKSSVVQKFLKFKTLLKLYQVYF